MRKDSTCKFIISLQIVEQNKSKCPVENCLSPTLFGNSKVDCNKHGESHHHNQIIAQLTLW